MSRWCAHCFTEAVGVLGYDVIAAADGAAAWEVLKSTQRIDLLLTDIGLPGAMNGRQLADAARTVRANLKVLFITCFAEQAVLRDGSLQDGMDDQAVLNDCPCRKNRCHAEKT